MDKLISDLEELTQGILPRLQYASYEEMSNFVEERQPIIDQLKESIDTQTLSSSLRERLNAVLQLDTVLLGRMQALKEEAANWLLQRGQAKAQRSVYETSYAADSILMDRRN